MNKNGLTDEQVIAERKLNGTNQITQIKRHGFLKLLLESLGDPIIRILLIALAIKVLFMFKDFNWYETIGILIAIFFASFISSLSEYGSEAAFQRLQEESSKIKVKVLRNGKVAEINIEEVVTNDVVILLSGDRIPADGYMIEGTITVDESALNGETKEVTKSSIMSFNGSPKKENQVFRGSVVYSNQGKMLVTSVGDKTIYGALAKEVQEKEPTSPLKVRLRGLASVISKIGYIGAILVTLSYLFSVIVIANNFDLDLIIKTLTDFHIMAEHLIYALTLSVTIIVVAVPEGLPMMITLVLSSNMKRMLKNNVLVRKLVGIETAGSLNVLLTDKTGTLTKGKLEVTEFVGSNLISYKTEKTLETFPKLHKVVYESLVYNNSAVYNNKNEIIGGNSTDKALLKFVKPNKYSFVKTIKTTPFDSKNKYSMATIDNGNTITYIKGASELIIPKCTYSVNMDGNKVAFLNKLLCLKKIESYTKTGSRVITLAMNDKSDNLENLIFIGFIVIKDELRKESKEGVKLITNAGIHTIMITGDAKDTATSIASEVGLITDSSDIVLSSDELNKYSDAEIAKFVMNLKVVARALPQDKSRLVKILEDMNLIVGMTGDGVNDAPALKKANVGFAMGSGTEVAKEAADIVILDDNILSISKAILFGRTTFKSIRKFIIYQLTTNMCALVLSIIGPFIGIDTPITIIQMLWLNMIMDTFAGLAFSFEPPLEEYMKEPPKSSDEPIMNSYMYGEILFTGLYSSLLCILFLKAPIFKELIRYDINDKFLMTAYFALFIFIGIFNSFNARSQRINILANLKKNKVFIIIICFIVVVQIYLIYFGGSLFRTYGLTAKEFALVLILAFTVIPIDWIRKIYLRKRHLNTGV